MRRLVTSLLVLSVVAIASAAEFHVNNGIACDPNNAGTDPALPLCTVQQGLNKITHLGGTIVTIHAGTYAECAGLYSSTGALDGTAAAPIIVRGDPNGATPTIDPTGLDPNTVCLETGALGCRGSGGDQRAALMIKGDFTNISDLDVVTDPNKLLRYWRIQNIAVVPTAYESGASSIEKNAGLILECCENCELIDIDSTSQPAFAATEQIDSDAIILTFNNLNILVQGSRVSGGGTIDPGFQFFAGSSINNTWITESTVADLAGSFWTVSGGSSGTHQFTFNQSNNMGVSNDGDGLFQIYNSHNLRIAYNRFFGNGNSSRDTHIARIRSYNNDPNTGNPDHTIHPYVILHNNFAKAGTRSTDAIGSASSSEDDAVKQIIFRNNLLEGWPTGLSALGRAGSGGYAIETCDIRENHNAYYSVTTPFFDNDPNCTYAIAGSSLSFSSPDPLDPNDCPSSGSVNIVNAGDPNYATPSCGTAPPDMGGCEFGCTGPWGTAYTFISTGTTTDTTPDLDWSGSPGAGDIDTSKMDFRENLKGVAQTEFRCQIDSTYTMNSQGPGTSLWDSGWTTSVATSCTSGATLTAGMSYWARIQLGEAARRGIWSMPFRFDVTTTGGRTKRVVLGG